MINSILSYNINGNKRHKNVSFKSALFPVETAQLYKRAILNPKVKTIDVYCHASPDEDSVDAAMATVKDWLRKNGKETSICVNWKKTKGLYARPLKKDIKQNSKPSDITLIFDFSRKSKVPKSFIDTFEKTKPEDIWVFDHHPKTDETFDGHLYIDATSKSTCGIVYRFFETLGEKLSKKSLERLYCGMLSDYQQSGLVSIKKGILTKLPTLDLDKNSKEVLEKIEAKLSEKSKKKVYEHLDVLSNLTKKEKEFQKWLFSEVNVTPKGNLAYVVIEPSDKKWLELGMKNGRTTPPIKDFCLRALNESKNDEMFSAEQKEKLKNIKGVIIFYRAESVYQMNIYSKDGYAQKLIKHVKSNINPKLKDDGNSNRASERISSLEKADVDKFINDFLESADKVD